jgi:hypothetical protein
MVRNVLLAMLKTHSRPTSYDLCREPLLRTHFAYLGEKHRHLLSAIEEVRVVTMPSTRLFSQMYVMEGTVTRAAHPESSKMLLIHGVGLYLTSTEENVPKKAQRKLFKYIKEAVLGAKGFIIVDISGSLTRFDTETCVEAENWVNAINSELV